MGFFGMSQSGKDAQAAIQNNAGYQQGQAKVAAQNSTAATTNGTAMSKWSADYWKNKANNGFASTAQVQQSGQELMPGVDAALAKRKDLLAQKQSSWESMVPKAADVMDTVNHNLDIQGTNIGNNFTDNENIIRDSTMRQKGYTDAAMADIVGSIQGSYDAADSNMNSAYNTMDKRVSDNYGGLIKESGDVYGKMGANVDAWGRTIEDLKPGSEASVATTARQFAPQMSAAGGRLRRAGVDPNSIQASAVLGDVEAKRAVAMDDKAAEGQQQYVNAQGELTNAKNNVLAGGFASKAGLTTDMTGQLTSLGRERAGYQQGIDLGRGKDFRDATAQTRDINLGIDSTHRTLSLGNTNDSFNRGQALLDKRNDAAMLHRDLATADYTTQGGLLDQAANEELVGVGVKKDQTQMGLDYEKQNETSKNTGAAAVTQMGENEQNRGLQWDAASGQWINGANSALGGISSAEAANSGWGLKGLMGIAGSALGGYLGRKK